jgi:hypothetical protein
LVEVSAHAFEEFGHDGVLLFIRTEIVYVVRTFVSGLIVESLIVMVARSNLECYISRANRSALLKVIKSMCDVDVELDADYKLDEDAVALGSIRLNCTGRSFKGSLFKEFMYTNQQQWPSISECGTVSVMRLTWSCQARFEGDDSRVRYLVGIREFRIGIETMVKQ